MSASSPVPLRLFNSLSREIEEFRPVHPGEARVYSCGPTVYNYPHIGNMRAYIFADTLGRVLRCKGYDLTHVINITDVGHLTDDGDAGEDKLEKMAATQRMTARQIADHYAQAYWADFRALNCSEPAHWSIATEFVPRMIAFAKGIADKHCYALPSGLYFDTSTVAHYGALARAKTNEGESRIDPVNGKRNAADFAIWRKTPEGETRQMEWDSPWGRGAPGWHLECSVMSGDLLGFPFDIHTGGIDHREIHHPNEIAQNQAHCERDDSGARIWMHNNFLIDRTGKMSKSSGAFLRLQTLVDRGFHPLSYRLMCLQAHYRSELEFSWENLLAAQVRLKRMVMAFAKLSASGVKGATFIDRLETALFDDLNTAVALMVLEEAMAAKVEVAALIAMAEPLGLDFLDLDRSSLRVRPGSATLTEADIEARLADRKAARAAKDFATSDRIRDELTAGGVEVMDGDPLGWDWKPVI
jgi:cysteinyl-tRNA synthetase